MPASIYVRNFALVMFAALATSCASNFDHRGEASCTVKLPPVDSGELGIHGMLMKVYPRISSMPAGFSGCQTLWVDMPGGWEISRLLVQSGRVVKLFDAKLECKYAGGKLQSATGGECPAFQPEVLPSEPAGCISQHVGGPKPREVCVIEDPSA